MYINVSVSRHRITFYANKKMHFFKTNADNWKEGLRIYLAEIDQAYCVQDN